MTRKSKVRQELSDAEKAAQAAKRDAKKAEASKNQSAKGNKQKRDRLPPLVKAMKNGDRQSQQMYSYFRRNFSKQDAARLAWMLCVADPFGAKSMPVPPQLAIGSSTSIPRMYPITMKGFAVVNAAGTAFIGLNADSWFPNPLRTAGALPSPNGQYLGNAASYGGLRGAPLHYTTQAYAGTSVSGSTAKSYPGPLITAAASTPGLVFQFLPDKFISVQNDSNPLTGNASQSYQCVAAGLRVRPTAPAASNFVPSGVILMIQQTMGDTPQTNPAAASGTSPVGGVDCYGYMAGLTSTSTSATFTTVKDPLPQELVSVREWDVAEWPHGDGKASWLQAAAIPNQSCCFAQWTPGNTGSTAIGYPQLAAVVSGAIAGQIIEFEAKLVYAFYGGVGYEENTTASLASVPTADLQSTVSAGMPHLVQGAAKTPARAAIQATAQPVVDSGMLHPKAATDWFGAGKDLIESATGSSIGDLLGEGLGFLAAALL